MLAFQLIGLVFSVLFFGPMITANWRMAGR
jgi:hypothetical protein